MEITNSEDHQKYLTILKAGKMIKYGIYFESQ